MGHPYVLILTFLTFNPYSILTQMQDQKKYQVLWMVISKEIER
jgi:hypothetical protein